MSWCNCDLSCDIRHEHQRQAEILTGIIALQEAGILPPEVGNIEHNKNLVKWWCEKHGLEVPKWEPEEPEQ